jgi:hypothetical protein
MRLFCVVQFCALRSAWAYAVGFAPSNPTSAPAASASHNVMFLLSISIALSFPFGAVPMGRRRTTVKPGAPQ